MTVTNNTNISNLCKDMQFQIMESIIEKKNYISLKDVRNLSNLGATCRHFKSLTSDFFKKKLKYWLTQMQLITPNICSVLFNLFDQAAKSFDSLFLTADNRRVCETIRGIVLLYKNFRALKLDSDTTYSEKNLKPHSPDCVCTKSTKKNIWDESDTEVGS